MAAQSNNEARNEFYIPHTAPRSMMPGSALSRIQPVNYNMLLASNPNFIQSIYAIVKAAGTRIDPKYNSEDITVIGGAAYSMFFMQLAGVGLPAMYTSDIDMVWWTHTKVQNDVITNLVPQVRTNLSTLSTLENVQKKLKYIISPLHRETYDESIQTITIQVSEPKTYAPQGLIINSNIQLSILINQTYIIQNICEIAIHNGVSSQRYTFQHMKIDNEMPAKDDPIYCDHHKEYTIIASKTRVPTVSRYITQQLFAYTNLRIMANAESIKKSHIRLYRVLHFCLINEPAVTRMIDRKLSESVIAILSNLTDIKQIKNRYIEQEVQPDLLALGKDLPLTIDALKTYQGEHASSRPSSHASAKGGKRKRHTYKRSKKNKRKSRARS
jgi:hypothetical protein